MGLSCAPNLDATYICANGQGKLTSIPSMGLGAASPFLHKPQWDQTLPSPLLFPSRGSDGLLGDTLTEVPPSLWTARRLRPRWQQTMDLHRLTIELLCRLPSCARSSGGAIIFICGFGQLLYFSVSMCTHTIVIFSINSIASFRFC